MMVWQVVTEGDRHPREHITACLEEKHARITAQGYSRYMPRHEDHAMVVPTAVEASDHGIIVHDHTPAVAEYISTSVLERTLAEEEAQQGETLLIEHLQELIAQRRGQA